jgi:HEPN domain-containing protein
MNKKELATAWLQASYSDLVVIKEIVHNDFLSHMVAFHSQQSIEKSFKALLEFYTNRVPQKHDLILLAELVSQYIDVDNEDILEDLNELYIDSRYPNSFGLLPNGKPTLENAKEFYLFADDIFYRVCKILDVVL